MSEKKIRKDVKKKKSGVRKKIRDGNRKERVRRKRIECRKRREGRGGGE